MPSSSAIQRTVLSRASASSMFEYSVPEPTRLASRRGLMSTGVRDETYLRSSRSTKTCRRWHQSMASRSLAMGATSKPATSGGSSSLR
eukprot:scaffold103128_cov31-Tisochrysis_lutea.AAC.2